MKYRVYISQVWSFTKEIEADSRAEADEEAERIAEGMTPANSPMQYGDTYVEVEAIK
jgi:hypothetical protein